MFSIEEYNTRIWYITKEYIKDHNVFVVYNHNNEIIYDFFM
ncbi:hypothetical protein SDC9_210018 [bioreactor metagenome]|uniref:Uncharacterized protein n=1 Tax=bioreactor metagenome TaxID=1076179 RepID=A0A645JF89_9ZZZZ